MKKLLNKLKINSQFTKIEQSQLWMSFPQKNLNLILEETLRYLEPNESKEIFVNKLELN